jgi:hypothetical protein
VREHRNGASENRAKRQVPSKAVTSVITQEALQDAAGLALWPDPERTFVASDQVARIDV